MNKTIYIGVMAAAKSSLVASLSRLTGGRLSMSVIACSSFRTSIRSKTSRRNSTGYLVGATTSSVDVPKIQLTRPRNTRGRPFS